VFGVVVDPCSDGVAALEVEAGIELDGDEGEGEEEEEGEAVAGGASKFNQSMKKQVILYFNGFRSWMFHCHRMNWL